MTSDKTPKYQIGDRISNWIVIRVYRAVESTEWVYELELKSGRQKLTCTESTINAITSL